MNQLTKEPSYKKIGITPSHTTTTYPAIGVQEKTDAILSSGIVELFIGMSIGYILSKSQKILSKKNSKTIRATEDDIKEILFKNTLHEKNPIVIYKGITPIFWNLAMENITGYTFVEIQNMKKNGVDIMELFYGHSEHELARVRESVGSALLTGEGYEERVFTLKNKQKQLIRIAWHNEILSGDINIRKGNIDLARKLQMMVESGATIEDLMVELMRQKDEYTSGHINRVMYISIEIAGLYGYDERKLGQLKIMAGLHDIGKTQVDDSVLKKPGSLTTEERKSMECHAGNGVYQGIKNKYGDLIRGMPHHSDYYNQRGNPDYIFEDLVERIKKNESIDPIYFNHLVGSNIPEEARIISIADTIDAIVSRRIYSKFLIYTIDELIDYLNDELLRATGLLSEKGKIVLDETKWRLALSEELYLPQCTVWENTAYMPFHTSTRIQFDPHILVKMYINGSLSENIRNTIRKNDEILIPKKIIEIEQYLFDFEQKLTDDKENWTDSDDKTLVRLAKAKTILEKFLQ